jgi:hypothetical protein
MVNTPADKGESSWTEFLHLGTQTEVHFF